MVQKDKLEKYIDLILKAQNHLKEVLTTDPLQKEKNKQAIQGLTKIINYIENKDSSNILIFCYKLR